MKDAGAGGWTVRARGKCVRLSYKKSLALRREAPDEQLEPVELHRADMHLGSEGQWRAARRAHRADDGVSGDDALLEANVDATRAEPSDVDDTALCLRSCARVDCLQEALSWDSKNHVKKPCERMH